MPVLKQRRSKNGSGTRNAKRKKAWAFQPRPDRVAATAGRPHASRRAAIPARADCGQGQNLRLRDQCSSRAAARSRVFSGWTSEAIEPIEAALLALCSCVTEAITLNCARTGVPLEGLEVRANVDVDPGPITGVKDPSDWKNTLTKDHQCGCHGPREGNGTESQVGGRGRDATASSSHFQQRQTA